MSDIPAIINTGIISNEWDQAWLETVSFKDLQPKPVLIITSPYRDSRSEEPQLQKMLEACKLTTDQYNIIQINENQLIRIATLSNKLSIKTVLLLGILPNQLGISAQFILNTPNRFADSIFIPALSIWEMEQQPELKKQLWNNALKPVFIENK